MLDERRREEEQEPTMPESADDKSVIQWIAGILAATVLAGGGFWLNYVAAQVDDLRLDAKVEAKDNALVRERLRGVEIKVEGIDTTTKQTADDVRRIRDSVEGLRPGSAIVNPRDGR